VTAITKNDLAALDRLLANELVYTHSSGVVETKAEYIGVLRTGAQKYDAVDYEDTKVMTYGNVGVVAAAVRMRGASKGQPFDNRLRMLHVWVERDGRWQLVAHQTTRLP
jgi:ketosteroid isomerase-like protein